MLERSGFGDDIAAFDEGIAAGDVERAKAGISDRLLGDLAAIGSADDVRAGVERYRDVGRDLALGRRPSPAPTSRPRSRPAKSAQSG